MSGTRKLGRPSDHRMAMLRGMVTYLLENGQIETTVTRAKEVRAAAEKMITIAKEKNDRVLAMRQIMAYVTKEDVAKKLVDEIGPRYADRKGGYTQIVKIGPFATEQAGRREGQQGAEAFAPGQQNIACHFPHRGGQTVHGLFQSRLNAGLFLSEKTREGRQ